MSHRVSTPRTSVTERRTTTRAPGSTTVSGGTSTNATLSSTHPAQSTVSLTRKKVSHPTTVASTTTGTASTATATGPLLSSASTATTPQRRSVMRGEASSAAAATVSSASTSALRSSVKVPKGGPTSTTAAAPATSSSSSQQQQQPTTHGGVSVPVASLPSPPPATSLTVNTGTAKKPPALSQPSAASRGGGGGGHGDGVATHTALPISPRPATVSLHGPRPSPSSSVMASTSGTAAHTHETTAAHRVAPPISAWAPLSAAAVATTTTTTTTTTTMDGSRRTHPSAMVTPPVSGRHSAGPLSPGHSGERSAREGGGLSTRQSTALAASTLLGERYEPNTYNVSFAFQGQYTAVEVVEGTAALWAGNRETGTVDVYSCVTGQMVLSLPARLSNGEVLQSSTPALIAGASASLVNASVSGSRRGSYSTTRRSVSPATKPSAAAAAADGAGCHTVSGASTNASVTMPPMNTASSASIVNSLAGGERDAVPCKPTALKATDTHMWVGYDSGLVVVYDHLVLVAVTEGRFQEQPIVSFAELSNGTVVSASSDGALVHWDVEECNFEAVRRVLAGAPGEGCLTKMVALSTGAHAASLHTATPAVPTAAGGAGNGGGGAQPARLLASSATASAAADAVNHNVVLCGFESGNIFAVDVTNGQHTNRLRGHTQRINDLAVMGDIIFVAAEDGTVSVWSNEWSDTAPTVLGTSSSLVVTDSGHAPRPTASSPRSGGAMGSGSRLLKRINVTPCARALLADRRTQSLWVTYADGLLERWSANPDDDFGVEEVVRQGMQCENTAGDSATARGSATHRAGVMSSSANGVTERGETVSNTDTPSVARHEVVGLLALGAVETLQVLALSSNGVNKVWYGHKNTLEDQMAKSIAALNRVISQDSEDTAVWRERVSLLKQKEYERKAKYVIILEQLSEQRVLLQFFERWRRRVVTAAARTNAVQLVEDAAHESTHRLVRRYFTKWASFYDKQQRFLRRYLLSLALADATKRTALASVFHRWQLGAQRRRVRKSSEQCAEVMKQTSQALLTATYFARWRQLAQHRVDRAQRQIELSEDQLQRLASKAQRQTLYRVLRQWAAYAQQQQKLHLQGDVSTLQGTPLYRFADLHARNLAAARARGVLLGWRRWAYRMKRRAALTAVAALRGQHMQFQLHQRYYYQWVEAIHAAKLAARAGAIREVEGKLRQAEAEHHDIFEKLQLQKHIDQLLQQQEQESWQLAQEQARIQRLTKECEELRQREVSTLQERIGPAASPRSLSNVPSPGQMLAAGLSGSSAVAATSMTQNAMYFRQLVDQQRLAPAVLSQMPLSEAMMHVTSQLKGNVLNTYTDLPLFRQVKDRRRAGTTAAAIFLEAFGEVKRMVVTNARSNVKAGGKSSRWPIAFETLDSIASHQCATVLAAIKTMAISFDLLTPEELQSMTATCEEVVANADWVFLISRACYMRRKPLLPVNNRRGV